MVPAAAVDKNAGDYRSVAAGRRGGDERVLTSFGISLSCSWGQLARWCGLGGAEHGRGRYRRRRAAKALCQRRCRAPEMAWRGGELVRGSAVEQGPGTGRVECGSAARRLSARACKMCALGAPRARTEPAR